MCIRDSGAPFETFVEADDPDDPDGGTHYKEEYQKEYDTGWTAGAGTKKELKW